jgi:hypothetical protein
MDEYSDKKGEWKKPASKVMKMNKTRQYGIHSQKSESWKSPHSRTWRTRHKTDAHRHARYDLRDSVMLGHDPDEYTRVRRVAKDDMHEGDRVLIQRTMVRSHVSKESACHLLSLERKLWSKAGLPYRRGQTETLPLLKPHHGRLRLDYIMPLNYGHSA